jgi:hypothetical protein
MHCHAIAQQCDVELIAHKDYITIVQMTLIKPVDNEQYDVCLALYHYLKFRV